MKAKIKSHDQALEVVAYSSKTFFEGDIKFGYQNVTKPVIILKTREVPKAKLIVVDIDEVEYVD